MHNRGTDPRQTGSMVALSGTPEQIGATWGAMNKEIIAGDMAATYLDRAAEAGISTETLIERSRAQVRIAERIAPHWLVEARATARAAGVDEELYVAFVDGQSRNRFLHDQPEECTSYAISRDHAENGAILFHKTRDNVDRPQMAPLVDSSLEGVNKFIAVTDGSRIRCSMMVNEKGLAGSGDYPADKKRESSTLQLAPAGPKYRGLMSGTILRYIAERASSCVEALGIIEDFVGKGYYVGGDVGGSHWLFVDREGAILEVCNNTEHVVSEFHTEDVYFSRCRNSAAARRLRESPGPVDFELFHSISRDPSICLDSSISGMTVEIDPDRPDLLTCAWIALPVRAVAIPLFMGQTGTSLCLVDGSAYQLGKATKGDKAQWEALEQSMHAEKQGLTEDVSAAVRVGKVDGAVEALDQWSGAQAAMLIEAMRESE